MSEYMSVSEFSKLHGKDVGNIRRLLASGRLSGQKIGNQWVIPSDAVYPADLRETDGLYRNQRKRAYLNRHKELMKIIADMISNLRTVYGEMLTEVILYGSYANETETDQSDVDIALIINGKPPKSVNEAMIDCVALHELECGKVLSVIDINSEKFGKWRDILPFYKNVRRDGIVLWKAK